MGIGRRGVQGWLETVWSQVFRDRLVIPPERFLSANFFIGLFAIVVVLAGGQHPERTNVVLTALAALTVATHVGGYPAATLAPDKLTTFLFVQGICLFAAVAALTGTSIWLALKPEPLTSFHYLPGLVASLLSYAALEIHFFDPRGARRVNVRRAGIALGVAGELALAAVLVWRLVRAPG